MWSSEGMPATGGKRVSWAEVKATMGDSPLLSALADLGDAMTRLRFGKTGVYDQESNYQPGGVFSADMCREIIAAAERAAKVVSGIGPDERATHRIHATLEFAFRVVQERAKLAERGCRNRTPDWSQIADLHQAVDLALLACEAFLCPFFATAPAGQHMATKPAR